MDKSSFIEPFLSLLLITNNDTIPLLPPGRKTGSHILKRAVTTLCGWFFRLEGCITTQKILGRIKKRRRYVYVTLIALVVVMFAVSSAPSYHAVLARNIEDASDERIVEEVSSKYSDRAELSPLLFGGAFVAEAYGAGTEERLGSGGQGEEPIGILVHSSSLVSSLSPLTTESSANDRNDVTLYTVKSGDTPSTIAARFGITTNTLLWANGLSSSGIIRIGDELKILPVTGLLHTIKSGDTISSIAKKFQSDVNDIISFNGIPADGSIRIGDTIVIPDGVRPQPKYYAPVQRYTSLQSVSGYFIFPTSGGRISQGLHGYNAVDIAHSGCYAYNVPVYAAAAGRVTNADGLGWNGGFGQFIKVQHSNGTATLYAHLRTILAGVGSQIGQGQIIGYMGSTGRSTGCHVHFEVHGARNPFSF